jgi:hypothetical protein
MKPTSKLRSSVAVIVAILMLALVNPVNAQSALSGSWNVQTGTDPLTVQFGVQYNSDHGNSEWSNGVPMTSLAGLTRDQLQSGGMNVRFDVVRDAGTLHCVGYVARGAGGGTFTFAPNASFADALSSRGIARPDDMQQLRMAMANVTLAFVDILRRNGSAITSSDEIIRVLNHGVNEAYVNGLAALGYRNLGAEDLVRLRDHGVNVDYVQGMLALGYRPTPDELVRLRDHGVTIDFVKRVKDHGYNATVEELIRMRDAGIS